jgi:hypothetical protein
LGFNTDKTYALVLIMIFSASDFGIMVGALFTISISKAIDFFTDSISLVVKSKEGHDTVAPPTE